VAVRADVTVTFAHRKIGMLLGAGAEHSGELLVAGLGIADAGVLEAVGRVASRIEPELVRAALGVRGGATHKYQAGSVLAIAGGEGKLGAALLCGRAALRSGAGICTLASWPDAAAALSGRVDELMTHAIDPQAIDQSLEAALDRRNAVASAPARLLQRRGGERSIGRGSARSERQRLRGGAQGAPHARRRSRRRVPDVPRGQPGVGDGRLGRCADGRDRSTFVPRFGPRGGSRRGLSARLRRRPLA
jgi:hypothetical protein